MTNLLNQTLKTFTLYALVVLAASVPVYYHLVDSIWLRELDEHNTIVADRIENELNRLQLEAPELAKAVVIWNKMQPGTQLREVDSVPKGSQDSTYTVLRPNIYLAHQEEDRFRGLSKMVKVNGQFFYLTVETNVEETEETVQAIALVTLLFFLILVLGFLVLNRRLSSRLWKPFRHTLSQLQSFDLNSQTPIVFSSSNTIEFEELNHALRQVIDKNISTYALQKEFTENAAHELQTPLAIISNKLDLLLQKEAVTNRQYGIIEEINKTLARIARINRNLLLLAKIENNQFEEQETIALNQLVLDCLQQLQEHVEHKGINISTHIADDILVTGNKILLELLVNNLLLNAIRHNQSAGCIHIALSAQGLLIRNTGNHALDSDNMFKRFARVSNESSGSGLGLALINKITIRHGWVIQYRFEDDCHQFSILF